MCRNVHLPSFILSPHVDVVVNFTSQVIFIFSFVSTSLAYIAILKNKRKRKITWDRISLLIKTFLELAEMMFGLVNVTFSLPEWQAVKMTFFAPCPVTSGVPQGSVLGPLMFLVFINDLPCNFKARVPLFANDTIIYLTIKSESNCRQLQDDFHSLEKWESNWRMEFNPSIQSIQSPCETIVEYSATVWDPYIAKNIQEVEMIQQSSSLGTRVLWQIRQCHWYVIFSLMEISGAQVIWRMSLNAFQTE